MDIQELLAREAIRQTQVRYNTGGDSVNYDELGSAFAEDGVIILGNGTVRHESRKAIIAGMHARALARGAAQPGIFQRHQITTSRVDFTGPAEASGRTYFIVTTELGLDQSGVYHDRYVKVGDAWLIARREIVIEWRHGESRFGVALGKAR